MSRKVILGIAFMAFLIIFAGSGIQVVGAKTKIEFWSLLTQPERVKMMKELIAKFEKENPDIEVDLRIMGFVGACDKMVAAAVAGNPPSASIMGDGYTQVLAAAKALVPLEDLVEELGGPDKFTKYLIHGTFHGTLYGLPLYVLPRAMFYWKDMLIEAGLAAPVTWDDFETACKKLTDPKNNKYGYSPAFDQVGNLDLWEFLLSNGVTIFGPKGELTFNNPDTVETYRWLGNIVKNYAPAGATSYKDDDCDILFTTRVLAFESAGPDVLHFVNQRTPKKVKDVGCVLPPKKKQHAAFGAGTQFVVYDTPQVAEAKRLIKFFYQKENLLIFVRAYPWFHWVQYKPVLESEEFKQALSPILEPVIRIAPEIAKVAAPVGRWYGPLPEAGEIAAGTLLPDTLGHVVLGDMSPEEAVDWATKKIEEMIKKYK